MFRKSGRIAGLSLIVAILVVLSSGLALGGGTVSIVGEVNEDFQIVTDNDQFYEIEINEQGEELIDHVGERVSVIGEVVEDGEDRLIKVLSYEVLEQEEEEDKILETKG